MELKQRDSFRCPVEGCGCEITVSYTPEMEATQAFVDCCGHDMEKVNYMNQATIITRGMNCDGCESRIEKALTQLEGVRKVNADHGAGRVEVAFSQEIDEAVIERRIEELGYEVAK